jgi:hypothetical protein
MKILIVLYLLISATVFGEEAPKKREMPERWYKLSNLVNAEIKAIQSIKPLSPRLGQRLIELHTERLELIKKRENQRFLNSTAAQRKSRSKDDFFKHSHKLMRKVKSFGLKQIQRFPRYIGNAEIYHTLALNSRDYGEPADSEDFLNKALSRAPKNSQIVYLIHTSLAEHHYNAKEYRTAIKYYEQVLRNDSDEWRSKHLFNASWCYLKTQNFSKAIDLLMQSYQVSKRPRMVSMNDQIMQSAGAFFVMGNKVQEGIDFYLSHSSQPTEHLLSMAKRVEESLGLRMTNHVLQTSLKEARKRKNKADIIKIQLQRLEAYRSFKKYDLHEKTAEEINDLYKSLDEEENVPGKEDAIYKITEFVGYLQIRLSKNAKINQTNNDPKLLNRVHNYFDILTSLNPAQKPFYFYYKAESSFAVSEYKQAANFYKISLEESKENKEFTGQKELKMTKDQLQKKVLDALLSILEFSDMDKNELDQLALYTYSNHIKLWPIDEKSRLIYKTLFNLFLEKKKHNHAKQTMFLYSKNYQGKKDRDIQRSMLTQIIDYRIKNKEVNALAAWINKLNTGFLDIEKDYIEKATVILGELLFESYKELQNQGKRDQATLGYQEIYLDERYPEKIKADASFYLGEIQITEGNYTKANEWFLKFYKHASREEIHNKGSTLYNYHLTFAEGQDFLNAISLADNYIKENCQRSFDQKSDFYKNRVYYAYLLGDNKQSFQYINAVKICPIYKKPTENDSWHDQQLAGLISNYAQKKDWSLFLSYFKKYQDKHDLKNTQKSLNEGTLRFYWDGLMLQSSGQINTALKLIEETPKKYWTPKQHEEYKSIKAFHNEYPKIVGHVIKDFTQTEEFQEELFNKELETQATQLKEIEQKVDAVMATGIPEYMLITASLLNDHYLEFAKKIRKFNPNGVPEDFVKSFKMAMGQLASGLESTALTQFNDIKVTVRNNMSLTPFNHILHKDDFDSSAFNYQYLAHDHVFPLDRIKGAPSRKIGQVERGEK